MTGFLRFIILIICLAFISPNVDAQRQMKFEQLGSLLPDPNIYRDATGSPGPAYWQQQVDYKIKCSLEIEEPRLYGEEEITYHNNSPSTLQYLWLQLDENQYRSDNEFNHSNSSSMRDVMSQRRMARLTDYADANKHGHTIESITTLSGEKLEYFINNTVLRLELPEGLKTGEKFSFNLKWNYFLTDRIKGIGDRGGYEYFEEEDNYIFVMTQWYPRLCAFTDYEGWQNKQFTGTAEFALQFGDFEVEITLPDDHVVGSTGECQNYSSVLTADQKARYDKATSSSEPVEIITIEEANKNAKADKSTTNKTWVYHAKNVRDFAWTASRKFMWDGMNHQVKGKDVMCMSYYGKEAEPLWRKYSTKTVAHALDVYSDIAVPYEYPVCISVEAANGMEYPMITFNDGRCEHDKTYSAAVKEETISTIIHEVGHQFFPMIVNSDERQWTWMDEGLNSYVELIACNAFDHEYHKEWVNPYQIADYMSLPQAELEPIMTNSENIIDFGSNCYDKPAAGLTLLRETIVGRELFDQAFREYAHRWAYKHPTPADFFRTIEDACGEDLDWFWKAWFYGTEPVDLAIDSVRLYQVDLKKDPKETDKTIDIDFETPFEPVSVKKNKAEGWKTAVERDTQLVDFYNDYHPWEIEGLEVSYKRKMNLLSKEEKEDLYADKLYYEIDFLNKGGHPMPIIIEWRYTDGSTEREVIPAQAWRYNEQKFTKVFVKTKKLKSIMLDPDRETADINEDNNAFTVSSKLKAEKIRVFKDYDRSDRTNGMQRQD